MVDLGDTLKKQQQGISSQNGIYRAAFPAFRVFIYGQEVSGDVTEVRVNQSGGSMDRAPGTCSFSLVNIGDKYILDHADMVSLASGRDKLVAALGKNVAIYEAAQEKLKNAAGEDDNVVADMTRILASSGQLEDLNTFLDVAYYGSNKLNAFQSSWADGKVPDKIKYQVIGKKATKLQEGFDYSESFELMGASASAQLRDPITLNMKSEGKLFVYPFSEGDCIFHPNDPIRIAFRDPFDPSVWWWMFSGFMDGWVEDRGSNQESIVTVVGTDISKIARYSSFQSNTDASLDKSILALFPGLFDSTAAELNWQAFQETFAKFSIIEIMELLFFGRENFATSLTAATNAACASMNADEVMTFLQNSRLGITIEDLKKMTETKRKDTMRNIMTDSGSKITRFEGTNFPPLTTPNIEFKTTFQRKSNDRGVHAFFIGTADNLDKSLGVEVPGTNLRAINDFLTHRVDLSDPVTMGTGDAAYQSYDAMSINDIVSTIGNDPWKFPVGGGRVVYVAPGGLGIGLADGVMNEMTNAGQGGVHTEFKDRLTYFYDLAEQIQFCFYATPRGDFVFEMPFFDFDPWMFDSAEAFTQTSDLELKKADLGEDFSEKIESWSKNSATYSSDEIYEIMQLSSDFQLLDEGFTLAGSSKGSVSYAQYFTVNKHETFGYSSAVNDSGLKTVARCEPHLIGRLDNVSGNQQYQYAISPGLAPTLGFRLASDKSPWTEIVQEQSARLFAAVDLRKCNSEARTVNLQILPRFGLMVNRPLYWRQRNYLANIVSCQHSIVPNSSCDTQVSLNYARAWAGEYKDKTHEEKFRHFGGELPFSYEALLMVNKRSS